MFQAPTAPAPSAPVTPPSTPPQAPITPPTRRASRTPLVVLIVVLLLAALGVGGYFAYGAWQQANNPQGLVEDSMEAMGKLGSATVNFNLDFTVTPNPDTSPAAMMGSSPMTVSANAVASYINDPANPQFDLELTLTLPTGAQLGPLGAMQLNPKISLRKKVADTIYARFDQLPPLPFFDLSFLNGQWVRIDLNELKQQYGINFTPPAESTPTERIEQIAQIYREHPFLVLSRLPAETVDGVQTDHLRFTLDRENLKAFLRETGQEVTEEQIKQVDEAFDQGLTVTGELWIGKQDHYLRQVTGALTMNVKDAGKLTANLRETFTGINQPVTIEEPADSISLDAVMQQLQPSSTMFTGSLETEDVGDTRTGDTDGDGLTDSVEQALGLNATKADTDGDGFSDLQELQGGYNPAGPGKLTPPQGQSNP